MNIQPHINFYDVLTVLCTELKISDAKSITTQIKYDIIAQAESYIFEVARQNYGRKYFWLEGKNEHILVSGIANY